MEGIVVQNRFLNGGFHIPYNIKSKPYNQIDQKNFQQKWTINSLKTSTSATK